MQHIPMLDKSDIFFDVFVSLMRQRKIKAHNKILPPYRIIGQIYILRQTLTINFS
jgi:hypothetical protein